MKRLDRSAARRAAWRAADLAVGAMLGGPVRLTLRCAALVYMTRAVARLELAAMVVAVAIAVVVTGAVRRPRLGWL